MPSEILSRRPRLRRALPWLVWGVALVALVPLGLHASRMGVAPAMVEIRKVVLISPRTLRVAEVKVAPGDAVKAGQVLARLDPAEVQTELAVARAELSRLQLEVASRGAALREDRLETADRLAAESERAALEAAQLEAEDQRDRSELAQLDVQIARQQKLVDEKLASAENLDGLKLRRAALSKKVDEFGATLRQAKARAAATARRLAGWKSGTAAAQAESSSPQPGPQVDPRIEEQLAPLRAAVEGQQERCRQLELLLSRLELVAPFDGRVGEVLAIPGDTAREGLGLVTVIDDRPKTAIAYVDQRWSGRVRIGDRATLSPSDRSGPARKGRVVALGASISEAPLRFRVFPTEPYFCREVFIALDEAAPLPGQAFDATFRRGGGR